MPKIIDNGLVRGARGNFGKQFVYKKRGDDTHIARMPAVNKKLLPSTSQVNFRELFAEASAYAKGVVSNPELRKEYQQKAGPGKTAFNMALRDYLKAPVVKNVDAEKYNGTPGSILVVKAKDDFRVTEVSISIHSPAGDLVEEGFALLDPVNRNKWIFTATQVNNALAGTVIRATAVDLPGNKGEMEKTL